MFTLVPLSDTKGFEPPPPEVIEESLQDLFGDISLSSQIASLVNLGTTRDARASSIDITRSPDESPLGAGEKRKLKIRRLYVNLYRPLSDTGLSLRLGVFVSTARTRENFTLDVLDGYSGELRSRSTNAGVDVGVNIPLGNGQWSIEPAIGVSYTRFKLLHDYVGDVGNDILKPVAEGLYLNRASDILSYRGILRTRYAVSIAKGLQLDLTGTYVHSYVHAVSGARRVQKTSAHFDTLYGRVRLSGPTRWTLAKRKLGWRVSFAHTAFVGNADRILGFGWFNRYQADLVWNYRGPLNYLEEISLGVVYLRGRDVEGLSLGFGIQLVI